MHVSRVVSRDRNRPGRTRPGRVAAPKEARVGRLARGLSPRGRTRHRTRWNDGSAHTSKPTRHSGGRVVPWLTFSRVSAAVAASGLRYRPGAPASRYAMVGVRYDRYNPDLDGSGQQGVTLVPEDRTYSTLAFAAALRHEPGRLVLEYDRNENALGRARSGLPTTLADAQIALRGEVVF